MEVIGAAASFVSIADAILKLPTLVQTIRDIVHSDEELNLLQQELTRLRKLHEAVREHERRLSAVNSPAQLHLLVADSTLFRCAHGDLIALTTDLQELANECKRTRLKGVTKASRLKVFWNKKRISDLRFRAVGVQSGIQLALQDLSLRSLSKHGEHLAKIQSATTTSLDAVLLSHYKLDELQTRLIPLLEALPALQASTPQSTPEHKNNADSGTHIQGTTDPPAKLQRLQATVTVSRYETRTVGRNGPFEGCALTCQCQCHFDKTDIRSPGWLSSVTGSFLLSYDTLPGFSKWKCNLASCRTPGISNVTFHHNFPTWISDRALSLAFSMGKGILNEGASLHLYFPQVYPFDNDVWTGAQAGDLQGVQLAVAQKGVGPNDMTPDGLTLVVCALLHRQFHVARFLINQWNLSRSRARHNDQVVLWARERLALARLDAEETSTLRIVTALDPSLPPEKERDSTTLSRTLHLSPLHLACALSNLPLVKSLISSGHPLDKPNWIGDTPLMVALSHEHFACASALIEAGADQTKTNHLGWTALYHAFRPSQLSPLPVFLSLVQGQDLRHHKDMIGRTPLHWLSRKSLRDAALTQSCFDALVGSGCGVDAIDNGGQTPLMRAVQFGNATMVSLLAEAGAKRDLKDKKERTVLHYAADRGTPSVLSALKEAMKDEDVDICAVDANGEDMLEIWKSRVVKMENGRQLQVTRERFVDLVRMLRNRLLERDMEALRGILSAVERRDSRWATERIDRLRGRRVHLRQKRALEMLDELKSWVRQGKWVVAENKTGEMLERCRQVLKTCPLGEEMVMVTEINSVSDAEDEEEEGDEAYYTGIDSFEGKDDDDDDDDNDNIDNDKGNNDG
ncbi:hypothetical protein QBC35DRAFT_193930 [Podospora australis]|uniref:Ankyrin n=1 Tax=Podospora australis TaxID=1536484 RepID=A0AAN7ACI6_9PEZI|nr:hypothetical protein QBC35DRAFT_193930 [Podospora australis]